VVLADTIVLLNLAILKSTQPDTLRVNACESFAIALLMPDRSGNFVAPI
jgi:hypothetical protein